MKRRKQGAISSYLSKRVHKDDGGTSSSIPPQSQPSQVTNVQSGRNEEGGLLLMTKQTFGDILCCKCGSPTPPNNANLCHTCLCLESEITSNLPRRVSIIHCPDCKSYLHPPKTWVKAERESKELLTYCLRRLGKLSDFRLIDAKFKFTEAHSKRIKLIITVQKEVLDRVYVEKKCEIEYVEVYQRCPWCLPANSDHWKAVVQARQHVSHMRTFHHLEQLIVKHEAIKTAVKIKQVHEGIDFFFAKKRDAVTFFNFMRSVVSVKPQNKFHKQLISQDIKSNISEYRFSIAAIINPVCKDDLIYLPPKLSSRFGQIGSLVICTKVRNSVTLLNPFTLKYSVIGSDQYWKEPFEPILSSKQLVEYIVLDVIFSSEIDRSSCLKQRTQLADVEIARVSDFGKNDRLISVRTHIGHLLQPGDYALGYDLLGSNFNNSEAEEHKGLFPDAVLIKKIRSSENQQQRNKNKNVKACLEKKRRSNNDCEEYQQFLRDLEENPDSRFNISLCKDTLNEEECSDEMESTAAPVEEDFIQLGDVFANLDLSDDDDFDGCITDN